MNLDTFDQPPRARRQRGLCYTEHLLGVTKMFKPTKSDNGLVIFVRLPAAIIDRDNFA